MADAVRRVVSERVAANSLLLILSLAVVFHLLVLVRIIPFEIVWGGRLTNVNQMIVFECISLLLNIIMVAVVGLHTRLLKIRMNPRIVNAALWLMAILFFLNTMGNLFSSNQTEKIIFTPITVILWVFCVRLAVADRKSMPTVQSKL